MSNWIFDTWLGIVSLSRYLYSKHNYRAHNPTKSSLRRKTTRVCVFKIMWIEMATSFLSCAYFKCKDTSKLEMKRKPHAIPLVTSPDHPLCSLLTCVWEVWGNGESKRKRKERQMGQERQPVAERKTMDLEPRAETGITMGDTQNRSRFPLIFSRL